MKNNNIPVGKFLTTSQEMTSHICGRGSMFSELEKRWNWLRIFLHDDQYTW
jgi:hypothetical protein